MDKAEVITEIRKNLDSIEELFYCEISFQLSNQLSRMLEEIENLLSTLEKDTGE